MPRILKIFTYAVATSLIAVLLWAAYWMICFFISAEPASKAGVLTAIAAVAAFIYNNNRQHTREIRSRQFPEKSAAYRRFFDLLYVGLQNPSAIQSPNQEYIDALREFSKELMIWGSADVINDFNHFIKSTATPPPEGDMSIFSHMERILRSLRNDLGHSDKNLEKFGVTKLLLKGDEHEKFDEIPYL